MSENSGPGRHLPPDDATMPAPGPRLVPGVDLAEEIGHGGFATVYRAQQESVQREVAVKIDHRRFTDDRNRRRFLREVTAVGRISGHPHVVSLIDAGATTDNRPYLVMELCPNGSLADLLRSTGPLPAAEARRLGLAITGALAAAHTAGILHRDVKPANVLIDAWGTPRLADFGLAAMPIAGQELSVTIEALTPVYAAPEAFRNAPPSTRTDVWSMGATLHALISPFQSPRRSADGSPASIEQILTNLAQPLPAPNAPGTAELMAIIEKATAYDPADRYADADELHDALAALRLPEAAAPAAVVGGPEATVLVARRSVPAARRSATAPRRGPRVALAAGALLVGAALGGTGGWLLADTSGDETPTANQLTGAAPTSDPTGSPTADASTSTGAGSQGPSATGTPSAETSTGPGNQASAAGDFETPPVGSCWGGLVKTNDIITATSSTCSDDHYYRTFAVGTLAPETSTPYLTDVLEDPNVASTCTEGAFADYTKAAGLKTNIKKYDFEVLPPRELLFGQGDRGFSCLLTLKDGDLPHTTDPS